MLKTCMKKKFFLLHCIIILLYGCSQRSNYDIVDFKRTEKASIVYAVYTPDTNWKAMEVFAAELLTDENKGSAVGFFYPKEKVPILRNDKYLSLPEGSIDYLVANYYFDNRRNKFLLQKGTKIVVSH